jgi:hypothetical protein
LLPVTWLQPGHGDALKEIQTRFKFREAFGKFENALERVRRSAFESAALKKSRQMLHEEMMASRFALRLPAH